MIIIEEANVVEFQKSKISPEKLKEPFLSKIPTRERQRSRKKVDKRKIRTTDKSLSKSNEHV